MNRNEYNLLKKAILSDPYYEKRGKPKKETWSARYKDVVDGAITYRRFSGGFKTKKACKEAFDYFCAERLAELEKVVISEEKEEEKAEITLSQLAESFLNYKKTRVKPTTLSNLAFNINKHLLPQLGDCIVNEITPVDLVNWQNSLSEYSYEYRTTLNASMKALFLHGEKIYDLKNPAKKVDAFRQTEKKKEMLFWTPEEFNKFIVHVPSEMLSLYFRFLYISGCRKGEGLALTWEDFDFQKNIVHITKNVYYEKGSRAKITTPKNISSVRDITMPGWFMAELKAYRDARISNATDYAFGTSEPLLPTSINKPFNEAIKMAGVKKIRVHDLRHSCASLLISKGFSIVAVSNRLGHASTKETLDTYAHLFPNEADKLVSAFSDLKIVGEKVGEES